MLEVFLGAILALAVRDLFYEALEKYKQYKFNKNLKTWDLRQGGFLSLSAR